MHASSNAFTLTVRQQPERAKAYNGTKEKGNALPSAETCAVSQDSPRYRSETDRSSSDCPITDHGFQ